MNVHLRRVAFRYAGFFILFCVAVFGFWLYGGHIFSILMARSRAYTPPQFLTWLTLASTLSLAVVFCLLPFSLFRIVRQRSDLPFGWVVLCIAGFLFLVGAGALFGLLTVWFQGAAFIWSLVLIRLVAALLAVGTLLILRALVPQILKIPTRDQWLSVNNSLLRAKAESEAKDKVLSVVSHELRTPLAPLLSTLTELQQHLASSPDPAVHDCIQVLRKNIAREAHVISDLIDRLELPVAETAPTPELEAPAKISSKLPRLLLVEDHIDTLRTFARVLRRRGFAVQEATTVSEALACCQPGDLLVSDIALPDGDGRDLMRKLSARGISGIAVSGFGTERDREEYRQAGFAESLVKPVDVQDIVNAIGRVTAAAM